MALGTGIAVPALPTLAKSFGVSFGAASGVVTAFLLGNFAGTIPSGWLIDRFGSRRVMVAGPVLTALVAFLVSTDRSFTELLILRFFNGFSAQMWVMARLAAISHGAAVRQRGRYVSWMFGMDNTGRLAGPVVGGFIAAAWGVRAPFLLYAVFALLAVIPAVLFAERAPLRTSSPRRQRSGSAGAPSVPQMIVSRLPYFGVTLFAGLTRGPVQADLLHLYAAFAYHLGPRQIGYLATGAAVLSWPIGFLAGWMMDRFGRKWTMVPGFSGVALSMTALSASAWLHLSLEWYIAFFLCAVGLVALTGGSVQTVGVDVAPPDARGTFLGIWRFTGQGGQTLSPIIFAVLADTLSYGSSFVFNACTAAIVAYLLVRHVPETRDEFSVNPAR